jgi:hypothetical protein
MMKFTTVCTAISIALAASAAYMSTALAQSLEVHNPAPMQEGKNIATSDNFVGSQYWYVNVEPGDFQIVFNQLSKSGQAALGSKLTAGMAYVAPTVKGNTFTFKESARSTVFTGHAVQPAKVEIEIDPPPGNLVRDASNYELTASGSVHFGQQASGDPIVGKYSCQINNHGWAKFLANGTFECSDGTNGPWKLFDADTRTYSIEIDGRKISLKLVPALGLVDQANNIQFQAITKDPVH